MQIKKSISNSLNIFDIILVQSKSFIQDLRDSGYTGKIEVVPYITDNGRKADPLPPMKSLQIGFLGRLVEDKNVSLLLKSFAYLKKKAVMTHLLHLICLVMVIYGKI
jgi:glycosyltransferase involved in cell wall biosynthesis